MKCSTLVSAWFNDMAPSSMIWLQLPNCFAPKTAQFYDQNFFQWRSIVSREHGCLQKKSKKCLVLRGSMHVSLKLQKQMTAGTSCRLATPTFSVYANIQETKTGFSKNLLDLFVCQEMEINAYSNSSICTKTDLVANALNNSDRRKHLQ